jgi:hypothetical protein
MMRALGGSMSGTAAALREFWAWWDGVRGQAAEAARSGEPGGLGDALTARVHAIHPQLVWSLHQEPAQALCVSAGGLLGLRPVVEAWRRSAPTGDGWTYLPARPAVSSRWPVIDVGGEPVSSRDALFRLELDADREQVHVEVWHPLFDAMPDELRGSMVFSLMDALLGEDGVLRWVGELGLADDAPPDGVDAAGLRAVVQQLADASTGERWTVGTIETDEGTFVVSVNRALKGLDHIDKPYWAVVRWSLDGGDDGLRAALDAEEELLSGAEALLVVVGRETGAGRRDLHLHVSEAGAAEVRRAGRELGARVDVRPDPRWEVLQRWG